MPEIPLHDLAAQINNGELTAAQALSIVRRAAPVYRRPQFSLSDVDVDAYADWEIRARALVHDVNELVDAITNGGYTDAATWQALGDLAVAAAELLDASPNPVLFALGYGAWTNKDYDLSIKYLEQIATRAETEEDLLRLCLALGYLVDSLLMLQRYPEAAKWIAPLIEAASSGKLRGQLSMAYKDQSTVYSQMGRLEQALARIREAIELREQLSEQEVSEQGVIRVATFYSSLGLICRRMGRIDDAIEAFRHAYEDWLAGGESIAAATALSDIGFVYASIADERAQKYLREAAGLAQSQGASALAQRWLSELQPGGAAPSPPDNPDATGEEAYSYSAQLHSALLAHRLAGAEQGFRWLIAWAEKGRDRSLELVARSNLANLYDMQDNLFQAVLKSRSSAQLAKNIGDINTWLHIQTDLANRYARFGDEGKGQALRVGREALSQVQQMLRNSESTEARRVIQAGAQPLYEGHVLLLMAEAQDRALVQTAEQARARNLTGWIGADRLASQSPLQPQRRQALHDLIMQLRALETESEETYFTGSITADRLHNFAQRREQIHAQLRQSLQDQPQFADQLVSILRDAHLNWDEVTTALCQTADCAVLYLFGLSEGIVSLVLRPDGHRLAQRTDFIPWQRNERLQAVRRWLSSDILPIGSTREDGLAGGELQLPMTRHVGDRAETEPDFGLGNGQAIFAEHWDSLFEGKLPQFIAVVPHREMQLLPYHEWLGHISADSCVTIAPSLQVLADCLMRQPSQQGTTILLSDKTGTLSHAEQEIQLVRKLRSHRSPPADRICTPSSVGQLIADAKSADLIHCAVHGLYNPDNPYRSGLLLFDKNPHAAPRLTVADVLSQVQLPDCRLVVLSACESGLARQHPADEYTGLPASFLLAGARTVIATQWPVDDRVAWLVMREFYTRWQGGSGDEPSAAVALTQARQTIRTMRRNKVTELLGQGAVPDGECPFAKPAYTAAFQVFGAW